MSNKNYLSLSDDDFKNQEFPPSGSEEEQKIVEEPEEEVEQEIEELPEEETQETEEEVLQEDKEENELEAQEEEPNTEDSSNEEPESVGLSDEEDKDTSKDKLKVENESTNIDYEGFYKEIMAPFKANGKMIELRDPEEAKQLMRMGANYTYKMQGIAPYRKAIMMLENNNLLDEDKLSYLIDLDKKNPEAIKKLIKDAGIDPLDIDTNVEPTYEKGNHRVSDQQVVFQSQIDDLKGTVEGKETLSVIHTTWDDQSKQVLWNQPDVMAVIHQQRESGIYDRITSEVDRQKALGAIPQGTSFLQAYKAIGDKMFEAGQFTDLVQTNQSGVPNKATTETPVAKRTAAPAAAPNGAKANAASQTRSTPSAAKPKKENYLAMSDDDFIKSMQGRL